MSIESYQALQQLMSKIDVPAEAVRIPGGTIYPSEVIETDEDGKVLVHGMISTDENLFSSVEAYTSGSGIIELLKRRVEGCHQPERLYEPDVVFLVAAIRAMTFTSIYEVEGVCEHCQKGFVATVDSNNLPVKTYEEDELINEMTLSNGQIVKWTYLPFSELMKLAKIDDPDVGYISRIMSVDGIEDRHAISEWFKRLPLKLKKELTPNFRKKLGGFEADAAPVECPHCGQTTHVEVDLLAGFFTKLLQG